MGVSDISLKEFEVFLEIGKTHSIRETARRFHVEAGQISRLMKRLEKKVGARLLERTATGVTLTQQGTSALKIAENVLREAGTLVREMANDKTRTYGIGSTSFLCSRLLGRIVGQMSVEDPGTQIRLMDVPPNQMISSALKGAFDMALYLGRMDWPRSWQVASVGQVRWQLFARREAPWPARCSVHALKGVPFVVPVYWTHEGFTFGNDQCPLSLARRTAGTATATAETALAVLRGSDQVAFLPEVLAREAVERKEIRLIHVKEWKPVVKELSLAVRSDVVPNRLFENLSAQLRSFV